MNFIDTHAHLNDAQFNADRHKAIERAFNAGVAKIVEIADGPQEWRAALTLCESYPGKIHCTLGFHPYHAQDWNSSHGELLRELLNSPHAVGIGEIGIDYAKSAASPQEQENTLIRMLEIANESGKPIVLHCREGDGIGRSAHEDLFRILKANWKPKSGKRFNGVLHCFSGGMEEMKSALSFKLALGADGPVTYPKNSGLRSVLFEAGLNHIVFETDSPYLPPQSIRGKRNEPSRIPEIAQGLAASFGKTLQETAQASTRNALELFGI